MPIRINLLAENQEIAERIRTDPVKRAIMISSGFVGLVLIWSGSLQLKLMNANNEFNAAQSKWQAVSDDFALIKTNRNLVADIGKKLDALDNLATNRFLIGPTLNALQYVYVPKVNLVKMEEIQSYQALVSGGSSAPKTNRLESIKITITARDLDSSRTSQDQNAVRFREIISSNPYFRSNFPTIQLEGSSQTADETGTAVQFSVGLKTADKKRL